MEDYMIYHNHTEVSVLTVIGMAKGAPDYGSAAPFLNSLFYAAKQREDNWLFSQCQDIMEKFGASPYPESPASEGNLPNDPSLEKEAKRYFIGLTEGNQLSLLRKAMTQLRETNVFNMRQHWVGVFLVVRDRLSGDPKQSHFTEYAKKFTPADWPEKLKIGSTMTNVSKIINTNESYYEMENNPYETVCDEFWNIILSLIRPKLTKI